jgi:hypothetical protein
MLIPMELGPPAPLAVSVSDRPVLGDIPCKTIKTPKAFLNYRTTDIKTDDGPFARHAVSVSKSTESRHQAAKPRGNTQDAALPELQTITASVGVRRRLSTNCSSFLIPSRYLGPCQYQIAARHCSVLRQDTSNYSRAVSGARRLLLILPSSSVAVPICSYEERN